MYVSEKITDNFSLHPCTFSQAPGKITKMPHIFGYTSLNAPFFHKILNFGDAYPNKPYFLRKKRIFKYASSNKPYFLQKKVF